MNPKFQYWIACFLIALCAFVITAGQCLVMNAGCFDNDLNSDDHPFDQRSTQTQWKRDISPLKTDVSAKALNTYQFITRYQKIELISLPVTFSIIISHFPHPPFEPRDPSRT